MRHVCIIPYPVEKNICSATVQLPANLKMGLSVEMSQAEVTEQSRRKVLAASELRHE